MYRPTVAPSSSRSASQASEHLIWTIAYDTIGYESTVTDRVVGH